MAQQVLIMAMQSGLVMSCGKFPTTTTLISVILQWQAGIADFHAAGGTMGLGGVEQGPPRWEGARNGFSSPFLAFNTNNMVMPPGSLLAAARPVFVVRAEVCPAEKFCFVILIF